MWWVFFSTRSSQFGQEEKGMYCLKFSTWNQSSTSMVNRMDGLFELLGFIELLELLELLGFSGFVVFRQDLPC